MKIYDCGDYYIFSRLQVWEVLAMLRGEGWDIEEGGVKEVSEEEYDGEMTDILLGVRASEEMGCTCDECLGVVRKEIEDEKSGPSPIGPPNRAIDG
ncbi:hypothetical protein LCGC14_2887260 [marine sediment metagenome]|uniref:Uncharacterized protein n=1 Tax=marine sediment metagenome TaxID=412755 RepID=A0A0F9A6A1_9ZZZZ